MKRFTDTEKWCDSWFRKLKPADKCFWELILDRCDNAGVWKVDLEAAEFFIGTKLDKTRLLEVFASRIKDVGRGRWWVIDFISFQCGELSETCIPHKKIVLKLKEHGLYEEYKTTLQDRVVTTLKEEEEEEEEDKEVQGECKGGVNPTLAEVLAHCQMGSGVRHDCATAFWNTMEGCGWLDSRQRPVVNWRPLLANFSVTFESNRHKDKTYGNRNNSAPKENPRNVGIAGDAEERNRRRVEAVARQQRYHQANQQSGNGVATAQPPDDSNASDGPSGR